MSLIADIAQYLDDQEVGTLGTDLFISNVPDAADTVISVLDTGGMKPDNYLPTKDPTFQVFIRAATYEAGKTLLDSIRALLHRKFNETVGSTYIYYCEALSEGGNIGRNARGLDEFSINFHCHTR